MPWSTANPTTARWHSLTSGLAVRHGDLRGMGGYVLGPKFPRTAFRLDPLLRIEELAEHLGVTVTTIYDWRVDGKGPCGVRVGRQGPGSLSRRRRTATTRAGDRRLPEVGQAGSQGEAQPACELCQWLRRAVGGSSFTKLVKVLLDDLRSALIVGDHVAARLRAGRDGELGDGRDPRGPGSQAGSSWGRPNRVGERHRAAAAREGSLRGASAGSGPHRVAGWAVTALVAVGHARAGGGRSGPGR